MSKLLPNPVLIALLVATSSANAAQSVVLPSWVCAHPDAIFINGFELGSAAVAQLHSNGSGGSHPGNITRQVAVTGLGLQTYYLYVPSAYVPNQAWPLIVVLHGAGGPGTSATAAQQVRTDWGSLADTRGFIIASPVGTNSNGGWNEPDINGGGPSDYDIIANTTGTRTHLPIKPGMQDGAPRHPKSIQPTKRWRYSKIAVVKTVVKSIASMATWAVLHAGPMPRRRYVLPSR